jgi:hypothetical protein
LLMDDVSGQRAWQTRPPTGGADPAVLMLVLVGGKHRRLTAFRTLARTAGLEVSAAGWLPSGRYVVECRPL